jgi:hypothetical protein
MSSDGKPKVDADLIREANRLACFVLEGQQRNYLVLRQLLRVLSLALAATIGLLLVLLAQLFK